MRSPYENKAGMREKVGAGQQSPQLDRAGSEVVASGA